MHSSAKNSPSARGAEVSGRAARVQNGAGGHVAASTLIDYDFTRNEHRVDGPRVALPRILSGMQPKSLLDVGCGIGTWLHAAYEHGITDLCGVDGVLVSEKDRLFPAGIFVHQDLSLPWSLRRCFDVALCLEVGEHLDAQHAPGLVQSLVAHSDFVVFSGACPDQSGQHHVNCRWPDYWQHLFNGEGYVCDDAVRWRIWDDSRIEPWYRQSLFTARRDPDRAGREERIRAVIHPAMLDLVQASRIVEKEKFWKRYTEQGAQPVAWYLRTPFSALWGKLSRRLKR